MGNPIT